MVGSWRLRMLPPPSTASSKPFMPFLNSMMPLPRYRPTSGSFRPNSSTPMIAMTIISGAPRPKIPNNDCIGVLSSHPKPSHRGHFREVRRSGAGNYGVEYSRPTTTATSRKASRPLRRRAAGTLVRLLDSVQAFPDLGDALAERTGQDRQLRAEQQQTNGEDDDQFRGAQTEQCEHGKTPAARRRGGS